MKRYKKQLQTMTFDEVVHEINVIAKGLDYPGQSDAGRKEGVGTYLAAVQEFNRRTEANAT